MTEKETFKKVNYAEQSKRLTEPFTMVDLAQIDDLSLSVFLCEGTLPLHRHLDQDELFLVHSGTISLESEWGTLILRPGELAVVPKGVAHRSSSLLRSLVLLLQPRLIVNRRNGHRRLFALKHEGRFEKVNVPAMGRQVAFPFRPVVLADVDTFSLNVLVCEGTGPWWYTDQHSSLILCHDGALTAESELGQLSVQSGELVIVPKEISFRLSSADRALVLSVQRHKQPNSVIPGR